MWAAPATQPQLWPQQAQGRPTPLTSQAARDVGCDPPATVAPCKNAAATSRSQTASWWQRSGTALERVLFEAVCPSASDPPQAQSLGTQQLTAKHTGAGGAGACVDGRVQVTLHHCEAADTRRWKACCVQPQWQHFSCRRKRSCATISSCANPAHCQQRPCPPWDSIPSAVSRGALFRYIIRAAGARRSGTINECTKIGSRPHSASRQVHMMQHQTCRGQPTPTPPPLACDADGLEADYVGVPQPPQHGRFLRDRRRSSKTTQVQPPEHASSPSQVC